MKAKNGRSILVLLLTFTIAISLTINSLTVEVSALTLTHGLYYYEFIINEDGFTNVTITYESSRAYEASWVFIPKFLNWSYEVLSGCILHHEIIETEDLLGEKYYFYQAFRFSYKSNGSFKMVVRFEMKDGALIIEPRGMFYSPQIGFHWGDRGRAKVLLPHNSALVKATAVGRGGVYGPIEEATNYVTFNLYENLIRLQVEFKTDIAPELSTLKQDIFVFNTVRRYEDYALKVLNLFDVVYEDLVDLFNVSLRSINVTFFIPDFQTFLAIGGYVPFTGERIGDIHINVLFVRAMEGILEVIALHELVHHFLYEAGLSPVDFLWFHEGMAQYVSIEVANKLGLEGASLERDKLKRKALELMKYEGDFRFLQQWKPWDRPSDITTYYVASYYVINRLAEEYDGLDYYKRFFRLIKGAQVRDDNTLVYYLSSSANKSVTPLFKRLGFDIADLYILSGLIDEANRVIRDISPLLQPYKALAEVLYRQALINLERNDIEIASQYLKAAIIISRFALLLTLITIVAIAALIACSIKKAMSFR